MEFSEAVDQALAATEGQPTQVQAAAVTAAIGQVDTASLSWSWKALIVGLLALLVLALAGVVWAVLDGSESTSPDVLVTVFASVLTGLIGLFVKSPVQKS